MQARRLTKLSQNESPHGPLPSVREAMMAATGAANRYPDNDTTSLTGKLAERLSVPSAAVAVLPGSVSGLQQLLHAVAASPTNPAGPAEILYAWRSFEAYPLLVAQAGLTDVQVPLRDDRHDLAAMADAVSERTRLIFLCQPNNPTGTVITHAELVKFLRRVPADCLVVLDEAYVEYIRAADPVDGPRLLADWPNLVLVRTFSKAYGLAGLRIGYLVGDPSVVARVRAQAVPFAVSSLAQVAALASLAADDELHARVEQTVAERARVTGVLRAEGYRVGASEGNFVWLPLGERTAQFTADCLARGVQVRPLGVDGVRVSIGSAAENDTFLAVATDWPVDARAAA